MSESIDSLEIGILLFLTYPSIISYLDVVFVVSDECLAREMKNSAAKAIRASERSAIIINESIFRLYIVILAY